MNGRFRNKILIDFVADTNDRKLSFLGWWVQLIATLHSVCYQTQCRLSSLAVTHLLRNLKVRGLSSSSLDCGSKSDFHMSSGPPDLQSIVRDCKKCVVSELTLSGEARRRSQKPIQTKSMGLVYRLSWDISFLSNGCD